MALRVGEDQFDTSCRADRCPHKYHTTRGRLVKLMVAVDLLARRLLGGSLLMDRKPARSRTRRWLIGISLALAGIFLTGRQSLDGTSVCYRDAWESANPSDPGATSTPDNPLVADWDWPFRRLDYILVRCGEHGGPTLIIRACSRVFDQPVEGVWASDHFGVVADLSLPEESPFATPR
jgi:hypothetical protein